MTDHEIKVLVVDDSLIARTILSKIISTAPGMRVVGTASNGQEALALLPRLQPDVVCTDFRMPVMDGLALTRRIMAEFPRPILVVSVSVQEKNVENIFNLLSAGAVDVFPKPRGTLSADFERNGEALISKIRVIAGVHVFARPTRGDTSMASPLPRLTSSPLSTKVVVIGASTGGPPVLAGLLAKLPASFALPIICVQHIDPLFMPDLVGWLAGQCRLQVKIAQADEVMRPGVVYFPQPGAHLSLGNTGRFQIIADAKAGVPSNGHCPSISVTMQAVAAQYGPASMGILLTGMGKDGADGMLAIAKAGGITIAQDERSCAVFGMPKAAIALGAAQQVLPPPHIAQALVQQGVAPQTASDRR